MGEFGHGVVASLGSNISIEGSSFEGGSTSINVADKGTLVEVSGCVMRDASFATISANGHASVRMSGCDIYPASPLQYLVYTFSYINESLDYEIDLGGNYWGGIPEFNMDRFIWDGNDDPDNHVIVNYLPMEGESVPTENTSWGSVKAMFR